MLVNQNVQSYLLVVLLLSNIGVAIFGVFSVKKTPIIMDETGRAVQLAEGSNVHAIASVKVRPELFYRFPEFVSKVQEDQWWDLHKQIMAAIKNEGRISIEYYKGEEIEAIDMDVVYPDAVEAIKKIGILYLVACIYMAYAVSVLQKNHDLSGFILSVFFMFCALYFFSVAPIATRSITLPYLEFKIGICIHYIASVGLITMLHYAWIYPKRKAFLVKRSQLPLIIVYLYMVLTPLLYLFGFTAFGTFLPMGFFWMVLISFAFVHSLLVEKDVFLKKQLMLSLLMPVLATFVFILFSLAPTALGAKPMHITYFSLFSLSVPFALSAAMDNIRLYQQRIKVELQSHYEKEQIRQDLHDDLLNRLAQIAMLSEASLNQIDQDKGGVIKRLKSIKQKAAEYSRSIRGYLWITDEACNNWQDLSAWLRRDGYNLTDSRDDMEFSLQFRQDSISVPMPSYLMKSHLYHIFVEAISNAVKHSKANNIIVRLIVGEKKLCLIIEDNGDGFELDMAKGQHYGLMNMQRRAEDLGGSLRITSTSEVGTKIELLIPLIMDVENNLPINL